MFGRRHSLALALALAPGRAGCMAILIVAMAGVGPAQAQTPAQKANELNDQGKDLYKGGNFGGAADKFRQAIVLSPEARFYFNLCATLEKMDRLGEALTACEAVFKTEATGALQQKTQQRVDAIKQKLAERGGGTPPEGGGTPPEGGGTPPEGGGTPPEGGGTPPEGGGTPPEGGGTPPEGGGFPPPGTQPPPSGVSETAPPPNEYKWSVGGDVGLLFNAGLGDKGVFADSGVQVKLHADFVLSQASNLGVQGYINFANLAAGSSDLFTESLSLVDVGGAIFQHRHLSGSLYFTPLVGAEFAFQNPGQLSESLITVGFRGDVGFAWVLSGGQHVISVTPMVNVYLPSSASGNSSDTDPAFWGLDKAGATVALTVGYTMRFQRPFGAGPLIILE